MPYTVLLASNNLLDEMHALDDKALVVEVVLHIFELVKSERQVRGEGRKPQEGVLLKRFYHNFAEHLLIVSHVIRQGVFGSVGA